MLQIQTPFIQVELAGHCLPQVPQFALSLFRLKQVLVPPQKLKSVLQTHFPLTQFELAGHLFPHAPQWLLFFDNFAQSEPQGTNLTLHKHLLSLQVEFTGH